MSLQPLLVALLVAAVGVALAHKPWRVQAPADSAPLGALTVGAAFLLAYLAGEAWQFEFPPREPKHTLALAVPAAAFVHALLGRRAVLGTLVQALGAGAFLWFALEVYREHHWSGDEGARHFALIVAGAGVLLALARPLETRAGPAAPAAFLAAFVGAALALAQSWGSGALLAGALACVPGGLLVLTLWRVDRRSLAGAALPLAWVLGGLLLIGVYFASTPRAALGLLLLAPQAGWLAPGAGRSRHSAWVPLVVAGTLAAAAVSISIEEPGPYGY